MSHDRAGPAAPVRRITVVGGGTAGWMAAALLSTLLNRDYTIRLVESAEIGTIGVGEATIPALRTFNRLLGLDEAAFMRTTRATFKLGIEFVDWRAPGHSYIHGFGKIGQDLLWLHTHQFWLRLAGRGAVKPLDHYALNCLAARKGRFALPDPRNPASPLAGLDYAYHLDASRYAALLRTHAEARGATRIEGRIVAVDRDGESGFVERLRLDDGRTVEGDLFLDCSGMRALLIGEALGVPFDSWAEWLPCDRALAVPCASAGPPDPFTRSTAREAGWQWRIPLQHRTGNGLVYASALLGDDEAADTLLGNLEGAASGTPRPVRFTPGRRRVAWAGNVVALGLAAGFLEPLESTSIHMIQTGLLRLMALFPGDGVRPADQAEYNRQSAFEFHDIRDFIIAHYKVTDREDTPFWRHVRHMAVPDSLAERLALFEESARFFIHGKAELFQEESWVQVLLGQGLAARPDPMVALIPDDQAIAFMRDIEEVIADTAAAMPRHIEFLARYGALAASEAPR